MVTANALLDDTLSRGESVSFEVVDATDRVQGSVHPLRQCRITNSTGQQTKRRLDNFKLAPSEYADLNPLQHRIKPTWNLSDGTTWPCGVFLVAAAQTRRFSYGTTFEGPLVDQGLILAQLPSETISFPAGTSAQAAITAVFEAAGFYNSVVSTSPFTFGSPIAYPSGKGGSTFAKILDELCQKAGYYPAYFNNSGVPTALTASTAIDSINPTLLYVDGGRIARGSLVEDNDLLQAPNTFVVVDTSATTGNVSYRFEIPPEAPHSYANRRFRITKVLESPGVGDVSQAEAVARAYYSTTSQAFQTVQFASPPDPRHDTFDVIRYRDGYNYLETSWTLTCAPGAPMAHTAVRSYL